MEQRIPHTNSRLYSAHRRARSVGGFNSLLWLARLEIQLMVVSWLVDAAVRHITLMEKNKINKSDAWPPIVAIREKKINFLFAIVMMII